MKKSIELIDNEFKLGILLYLQYERDERYQDMIDGGFTEEESVSIINGYSDEQLMDLINKFVETQHESIDENWENYDDGDYDNAVCNMCWEWICEELN